MKKMSRILAAVIALVMAMSAMSITLYAADKITLENDNIIDNFDPATVGRLFKSGNQTTMVCTEEGIVCTYTGQEGEGADPSFTFPIANFYKMTTNTMPTPENAAYIVFTIKASEECDGNFEVFTHQPAAFDSGIADYYCDGEWNVILVDMFSTTLTEPNTGRLSTMRVDWSATGTLPGATMTIKFVAFFGDEDEAYNYVDEMYEKLDPNYQPATEAPTAAPTEAPTSAPTEAPTEAPSEAPTEAEKSGCGSVVMGSAAVLLMAAAAAVALRKH